MPVNESKEKTPGEPISLALDLFALSIAVCSISSVALLSLGCFEPIRALLLGIGSAALICSYWQASNIYRDTSVFKTLTWLQITALFAIALMFRSDLFLWVGGGQDQGVYVNMASHFQKNGSPFLKDLTRDFLPDDLKVAYDETNRISTARPEQFVAQRYEGEFLPGVYIADLSASRYVFQFFPVHPAWMSITAEVFGDGYRTLSTNLFSIISILFFYLILLQCTNHFSFSFFGAAMLCVNPLHSFFAKFPVSESVTSGLSLAAFFYLITAFRTAGAALHIRKNLFISWALFSATFFTHISGFMYVPFFIFLLIYREIYLQDPATDYEFRVFFIALLISLTLSVGYGLTFSYPYASTIYRLSFESILGSGWPLWLSGIGLLLLAGCVACIFATKRSLHLADQLIRRTVGTLLKLLPLILLACALVSAFFIFRLGFTEFYVGHKYDLRWGIAGAGWGVLGHWSPFVFSWYASPFLLIFLLIYGWSGWKEAGHLIKVTGVLFGFYLAYIFLMKWFVPYQYYFARYQVSELLPAFLLFVLLLFHQLLFNKRRHRLKRASIALFALYIPYSIGLNSQQLNGAEQEGLYDSIKALERSVGSNTVLLVNSPRLDLPGAGEMKTALLFQTDLPIVSTNAENQNLFADHFCAIGHKVGVLSAQPASNTDIKFEIRSSIYSRHPSPTLELQSQRSLLYYKSVDCVAATRNMLLRDGYIYKQRTSIYGDIIGLRPESDFTGDNLVIVFEEPLPIWTNYLKLETFGWTPLHVKQTKGFISGSADGKPIWCESLDNGDIYCQLDKGSMLSTLSFSLEVWQPLAHGINDDRNFYGLDIKSLRFVD